MLAYVLSPVEEITRSISARLASIAIVIPCVCVLIRTSQKIDEDMEYIPWRDRFCILSGHVLQELKKQRSLLDNNT